MSGIRSLIVVLGVVGAMGCGTGASTVDTEETEETDEDPGGLEPESPAASSRAQVCDAALDAVGALGASQCDQAIAEECEELVSTFSEPLVDAVVACLANVDASPLGCIAAALADLRPTAAHLQLASTYCSECAWDVPGCEQLFYSGDEGNLGFGLILLPFSDEVVHEITAECTESFACSIEFPGCVRGVLEEHLVPDAPYDCVLGALGGG